jgi:23S rRNA pseudouridine2605 synthase
MRLQKFISAAGITSRRKSEILIKNNLIKINGKIINELGVCVDPQKDIVSFKDERITIKKFIYIILNKPIGYVTTLKDNFNRPCILDLIKIHDRVFPVGRLDFNTSGLLILTNDGDIAYKITHPKFEIHKTYIAKIDGELSKSELKMIRNGVVIDNKKTNCSQIEIISQNKSCSKIKMIISEGRNREIRKIFEKFNHKVIELKRIAIENLKLDNLKLSEYKFISKE